LLESRGLPGEWREYCFDAWQKIIASSRKRAFRDPEIAVPIIVRLVSVRLRTNVFSSLIDLPVDRKAYLAAAAILGPSTASNGEEGEARSVMTCHEILSRVSSTPVDLSAVHEVKNVLAPHLQGKTSKVRTAITCFVAWQCFLSKFPSFNAMARMIGVAPASLRTALESLARSMQVEWKGTATRFDGLVMSTIAKRKEEENSRGNG
jgi:hypothetical protein